MPPVTGNFVSGKEIKVVIDGAEIAVKKHSFLVAPTQRHDTTNSKSRGKYESQTSGARKVSWSFEGDYDLGTAPLSMPDEDDFLYNVEVYVKGDDSGSALTMPIAAVEEFEVTGDVDSGPVHVRAKGTNHGDFDLPTT